MQVGAFPKFTQVEAFPKFMQVGAFPKFMQVEAFHFGAVHLVAEFLKDSFLIIK